MAKRQRASEKKEDQESEVSQLLELEKKRQSDDHAFRMQRLEYDKDEQKYRMAQIEETSRHNRH